MSAIHYGITKLTTRITRSAYRKTLLFATAVSCLAIYAVLLLAQKFSPVIEAGVAQAGLPATLIGVASAFIILLSESIPAIVIATQILLIEAYFGFKHE